MSCSKVASSQDELVRLLPAPRILRSALNYEVETENDHPDDGNKQSKRQGTVIGHIGRDYTPKGVRCGTRSAYGSKPGPNPRLALRPLRAGRGRATGPAGTLLAAAGDALV